MTVQRQHLPAKPIGSRIETLVLCVEFVRGSLLLDRQRAQHLGREDQRTSAGIYSESGCNNNRFEPNLAFNIGKNGMVDGSFSATIATGNQWINNRIRNVGQVGMLLANARNAVVKNNLIIDSGKSA